MSSAFSPPFPKSLGPPAKSRPGPRRNTRPKRDLTSASAGNSLGDGP